MYEIVNPEIPGLEPSNPGISGLRIMQYLKKKNQFTKMPSASRLLANSERKIRRKALSMELYIL
jgi:hypothetical protein